MNMGFLWGKYLILYWITLFTMGDATLIKVYSLIENETVYTIRNHALFRRPSDGIEGFLVKSEPPDACTKIKPPPDYNGTYLMNSILLANWGPKDPCPLLTKIRLADEAGYAAIIIECDPETDSTIVPVQDWDYVISILIGHKDGEILRANYTTEDYIIKFEDEEIDTWTRFFVTGFLALLAILLAISLSYCIVQMLILLVVWLRDSVVHALQQRRINRRRRLPSSQLKKIPIQQWTNEIPQDMCTICLENFLDKEKVRILPCSHVFHMVCIDPWLLNQRRKCPNCKRKIVFPNEPYDSDSSTEDERTPLIRRETDQTLTFTFNESDFANHPQPIYRAIHRMMAEAASNNVEHNGSSTSSGAGATSSALQSSSSNNSATMVQTKEPITPTHNEALVRAHIRRMRMNKYTPKISSLSSNQQENDDAQQIQIPGEDDAITNNATEISQDDDNVQQENN